ncbi:MAG: STAS domain-containing protein [Planctomycetota bacterium]
MPIQEWSDQIWVVRLLDEPAFSDELRPLIDRTQTLSDVPSLVIDLAEVTQINSSNLSQLLRLRKAVADRDTQMKIAGPTNAVWSVFMMTGLDKVFSFTPDTSTALAELQLHL